MASISYSGNVRSSILLGDGGTIAHPSGIANVPFNATFPNLSILPVVWKTIPVGLDGLNLSQVLANRTYFTTISTTVTLTGNQNFSGAGSRSDSTTIITYTDNEGRQVQVSAIVNFSFQYNSTTNLNSMLPTFNILTSLFGTNIQIDFQHYDATQMKVDVVVTVTALLQCTGNNINSQECMTACNNGNPACLSSYLDFCFPNTIGTDTACQTYFADYIANNGPNAQIDTKLNQYCTKFKGFGDLFTGSPPASDIDIQLCACHMPDAQYTAFENEITQQVPALKAYPQLNRCFLPRCISSKYHSQPIPISGCPVSACVSIGVFNNNGTFSNSSIIENAAGCTTVSDTKTVEIVVFIIIIIIIIAIAIYFIYYYYYSDTSNAPTYVTTNNYNDIPYNNTYVTS